MSLVGDDDVPQWAWVLGTDECYHAFVEAIGRDLLRRGYSSAIWAGKVQVSRAGEQQREFGLSNLLQRCATYDRGEYDSLVRAHFDTVFAVLEHEASTDAELRIFDNVKARLRLRLYGQEYVAHVGSALMSYRQADDLFAGLVLDLPKAVRSIGLDLVKAWERESREAFDLALANVRAEGRLEREEAQSDMGTLIVLRGSSYFAASHALLLDDYLEPMPRHGALVAIPNRHEVFLVPITGARVTRAIPALSMMARDAFTRGPGSITSSVFWRRADGTFERVADVGENGRPRMISSKDFDDLMKRLSAS